MEKRNTIARDHRLVGGMLVILMMLYKVLIDPVGCHRSTCPSSKTSRKGE